MAAIFVASALRPAHFIAYSTVKYVSLTAYRSWFRHMHFLDKQKELFHKPTLLVSNHQSAFTDPIIIAAAMMHRRANFLVRGDIFKKPLARYILTRLNQIPIYRARDLEEPDMKLLAELNDQTFKSTLECLKKSQYVVIFPEGDCIQEKRLRPVRKGTARMAFQFLEEADIDLQIFPVGLTYTGPLDNQEDVFIVYGDCISVKDYWQEYKDTKARAINHLTKDIQAALDPLIVSLPKELEKVAETATRLVRYHDPISPFIIRNHKYYQREKKVGNLARSIANEDKPDTLTDIVTEAQEILDKHDVHVDCVREHNRSLALILPAVVLGIVAIPGWLYFSLADVWAAHIMNKVKGKEFKPSIRLGSIGFLYPIFLAIATIPLTIIFGWLGLAMAFGLLFSRVMFLYSSPMWRAIKRKMKMNGIKRNSPEDFNRLIEIRKRILDQL